MVIQWYGVNRDHYENVKTLDIPDLIENQWDIRSASPQVFVAE